MVSSIFLSSRARGDGGEVRAESGGGRRTRKEAKGGKEKRGRVARFFLSLFPHLVIHKPRDDRRLPHGLVAQKDLRVVFFESRARGTRRGVGGLGGGGEERGRGRTRCAVFFFFFFFFRRRRRRFFFNLSFPGLCFARSSTFPVRARGEFHTGGSQRCEFHSPACTWRGPPSLSFFDFFSNASRSMLRC